MCGKWAINFGISFFWLELKLNFFRLICSSCFFISHTGLTAQFHGSVLRPDLTQNSAKAVLFTMYVPTVGICTQICARTWAHYNEISHASAQVKTAFTEFWVKTKIFLRAEKYFWISFPVAKMWAKMWAYLVAKLSRGTAGLDYQVFWCET